MTKLSNLEKIRKAYAMNYAAQLRKEFPKFTHTYTVVCVSDYSSSHQVSVRWDEPGSPLVKRAFDLENEEIESFEITSYIFMGQLGGDEPVPEGQRFRVKETGEVLKTSILQIIPGNYLLDFENGKSFYVDEIEPVF